MTATTFRAEIADQINRDDLTSQIPIFIVDAECRLNRELIVPERETVSTISVSAATAALPADFWAVRSIYVDAATDVALEPMSMHELRNTYGNGVTGTPTHYAIQNVDTLFFGPVPNGTFSVKLNYYGVIPPLASNSTNWLLTAHQDLYRAATLTEAFLFMMDEKRANLWDSRTVAKIAELQKSGNRKRMGGAPLYPRGPNPSIRGVAA
jgi:hypothetical protein